MRTRTRLKNLPCHYSQAKSSVHHPSPSGKSVWMLALLVPVATPRPRRLIPRGAGPTEPDRWGRGATHPIEGDATWAPKGPLGRDGPVGHGGASPSGVRGPCPRRSGCGGPAPRSVRGRRGVRAGTRPGRSVYMPNGLAVSFRRRQPVTGLTYYLLYEPKSYSSSGTASPEPWPKA